jgi:hypothetical protein
MVFPFGPLLCRDLGKAGTRVFLASRVELVLVLVVLPGGLSSNDNYPNSKRESFQTTLHKLLTTTFLLERDRAKAPIAEDR